MQQRNNIVEVFNIVDYIQYVLNVYLRRAWMSLSVRIYKRIGNKNLLKFKTKINFQN